MDWLPWTVLLPLYANNESFSADNTEAAEGNSLSNKVYISQFTPA